MSVESFMAEIGDAPLTSAFKRRAPVMPFRGAVPIPESDTPWGIKDLMSRPRAAPTVAYIHIPFCHNHCLFCGFYQNPWESSRSAPFVDILIEEIRQSARRELVAQGPAIEAVYFGGGTPTALAASDLARLLRTLRSELPLADDCEITLEGRVHDFGIDKAQAAVDAGVNRISLGVQSFDTLVRRRLGRKTAAEPLIGAVADLAALPDVAVVIDLMYGLPGQDDAAWLRDLEIASNLELDGLDVYALSVWPKGPLAQAIAAGKALPLPELSDQARAYAQAGEWLARLGWRKLSHAHFGRTKLERNIYNRSVKEGAICLAFGPGAGGYAHGYRWRNTTDLALWENLVADGQPTMTALLRVAKSHDAQTRVVAGLEAGTLDCRLVDEVAPGFSEAAQPLLSNWCRAGLADFHSGILTLTHAGWFWMTTLTAGLHTVLDMMDQRMEARA